MSRASLLSFLTVTGVLGTSACASPAANLHPAVVGSDQGALFGRITVANYDDVVTDKCYADFTGADESRKAYLSLDATGWVFNAVEPGPTFLSRVVCVLGTYVAEMSTRDLEIKVPGNGKIVYFGDVQVDMRNLGPGAAAVGAGAMIGGALGALISVAAEAGREPPQPVFHVGNDYAGAVAEYKTRYGAEASALQPFLGIAGGLLHAAPSNAKGGATTIAGFSLGENIGAAAAHCTGNGLAWVKLSNERFSCGGAPIGLGMPATVQVTACDGIVCEVAIDASGGGATRNELSPRLATLYQTLAKQHGEPQQRTTEALSDCTVELKTCVQAGRARTLAAWRSPGKQSISLVLDGGPSGGRPSLTLVYRTLNDSMTQ